MANIVYILGAGASAQAIPTVADSLYRFEFFLLYLEITVEKYEFEDESIKGKILLRLTEYSSLLDLCKEHVSFDTLAKKLYLRDDHERLIYLKEFLSLYYIFENYKFQDFINFIEEFNNRLDYSTEAQKQIINEILFKFQLNNIDFRYDSFIAGVSDKLLIDRVFIPKNISILSWNYDLQFEFALNDYDQSGKESLDYMFNPLKSEDNQNDFSHGYIKLNGCCGYFHSKENELNIIELPVFRDEEVYEFIFETMITFATKDLGDYQPYINFAWEENDKSKATIDKAHSKLKSADSIVVVGYSFPTFNREVDKILFSEIDLGKNCKIYIQTPNKGEFEKIKTRIQGIANYFNDEDFEFIDDISQFYVPFEFNKTVDKKGNLYVI